MKTCAQPSWVVDESIWKKAHKSASKKDPGNLTALASHLYKKMGGKLKGKTKAADSSTSFPGALRAGVEESIGFITTKFTESEGVNVVNGPLFGIVPLSRFQVCLIEEGMGNMADAFYYTKEALRGAVRVFEGKKIYADHPSAVDEQVRPERSVRDILGWFENVRASESGGRVSLVGDVALVGGESFAWARDLMREAVDYAKRYADKQFVGLSINATGEALPVDLAELLKDPSIPESARVKLKLASREGITKIRKVTAITEAVSCDLVTEAGAGGKVLSLIEQEKKMADAPELPHDDAAQDRKLIDEMLAKYFADGHDDSDSDMATECMTMAREMGYSGDEAMVAASTHMKMMKYKAKKVAETDMDSATDGTEGPEDDGSAHPAVESENPETIDTQEADLKLDARVKELEAGLTEAQAKLAEADKKLLEANGLLAAHEEQVKKSEVIAHLDSKLAESKLPNAITKKFRETIGDKCKNKADIDEKWDMFKEAYEAGKSELQEAAPKFVFSSEKFTTVESDAGTAGGKISLTDCFR